FSGVEGLLRDLENAQAWEKSAQTDLSLLSASMPLLAQGFDRLWAKIEATGSGGLSAIDLIEGSAIVFQHLLTEGRAGLDGNLAKAWDATGSTYRKAFEVAQAKCGARALDILLPAAALALRYSNPPEAYLVFLEKLNTSTPGGEIAAARALTSNPPEIRDAGEYLGTALDVRRMRLGRENSYSIYDDFLDNLEKRSWGFDEIELLSDPGRAQKIDSFPFVAVVKEGPIRTQLDSGALVRRLLCASLVLRAAKLPRYRRDAEKRLMERMHPIVATLFDPKMAVEEYNQLGLKYLDQGDTDQAEIMLTLALSICRSHQHQQGIARQLYNLGLVYTARRDGARAQEMYQSSLTIAEEIEDPKMIAQAAANLGGEYMKMKVPRLEEAETLIRRALKIEEGLDLKAEMAIDYVSLGRIYLAHKNSNQAREFFTKAVGLYRAVGNDSMANSIEGGLAIMNKAS
ncbi:MAG: tetratricopeptide repeat protein, partial [Terracidiphilus sp.]